MADPFKVGDVVELQSGGPQMTVSYIERSVFPMSGYLHSSIAFIKCQWMDLYGVCHKEEFPVQALKMVSPFIDHESKADAA